QPFVTNFLHPIALRFGASRVARAFLVCVLPPVPRCSDWASSSLISPSRISLPRKRCRVGLHIDLFGACSAFTRVAARTLVPSPICDQLHRRLQPFRHLHDCSGCFRLERSPGGARTHWKAPPCHGARRVEVWRGDVRLSMSVSAPFVWRCLRRCPKTIASFRETSARCCSSILDGMSLGSC